MAKAFSVLSWNVEHFGATNADRDKPNKPVGPIIELIAAQKADVIAIYEVVGKVVFTEIAQKMPNYQFYITEGPQTQEILVGVKRSLFAFFTQKLEFKSGEPALRPGALLTLVIDGVNYPLLFLHLKSLSEPKGFGLRDDMTQRAMKFRKVLNRAAGQNGQSNFVFLGDLNTMGMNLSYSKKDISGTEEIDRMEKRLAHKSINMRILNKSQSNTYWPGANSSYEPSNLDHVVAAEHMKFKKFGANEVRVSGWVDETSDAKKDDWVKTYSDHAMLYFEVQKV